MAIFAGPLPISPVSIEFTPPPSRKDEMQSLAGSEPIQLPRRFSLLKQSLVAGKEEALASSWERLLRSLSKEVDLISSLGSQIVPTIDFVDINKPEVTEQFKQDIRQRGVAVIRNVLPRNTAFDLFEEAQDYLDENADKAPPHTQHTHLEDVYWGHAQIKARAHPNILAAQKFAMGLWNSKNPTARVATYFPIAYADRMRIWKGNESDSACSAHIDGGSVERWESDGYGRAGTYQDIFDGNWEQYDPWESSTRLNVTSDLYHRSGACSIFRMYQGWLSLSSGPSSLKVCPMPRHATAYFLLRPFFSPQSESEDSWSFTSPQNSILHGALPSYAQEISSTIHPHLQLDRSLIEVPKLERGDYLIWHPDLIHSVHSSSSESEQPAAVMYLPACPLTQTNALYLSRQRKAFLLGCPPPDFGGGRGESNYAGRPGVEEVNDAGGEEGLRAMGLLPWDEEEAFTDEEREVLAMANGILFPEMYDML